VLQANSSDPAAQQTRFLPPESVCGIHQAQISAIFAQNQELLGAIQAEVKQQELGNYIKQGILGANAKIFNSQERGFEYGEDIDKLCELPACIKVKDRVKLDELVTEGERCIIKGWSYVKGSLLLIIKYEIYFP
jgi:hypothetical protein